jgi:hypothetical protein
MREREWLRPRATRQPKLLPRRRVRRHGRAGHWRKDPEGDIAAYVEKTLGQSTWNDRARVKVHVPAERMPAAVVIEAIDARRCFVNLGSDSPRALAFWLAMIDADFEAQITSNSQASAAPSRPGTSARQGRGRPQHRRRAEGRACRLSV